MEFVCVLSVNGSLASYLVQEEEKEEYTAELKDADKRRDIPSKMHVCKKDGEWEANPWHEEIGPAIIHAIKAGM